MKRILQGVAIAHIFAGIALPFLVNPPLFAPYNARLYRSLDVSSTEQSAAIVFLIGLFGPTIASWGVLFLHVVTVSFKNPDQRGWWTMFLCCLAWAPYDSLLSMQKGIWINALINLISALIILIPLFVVRRAFFHAGSRMAHE